MTRLVYPFTEAAVRGLRIGEEVLVSGLIFTGRDRLHKHLYEGGASPVSLADGALYHCGPVVVRDGAGWRVTAAGPTTSSREEPYMAEVIRRHGVRLVLGKGGMGAATAAACREVGCAYLQTPGGCAALLAERIRRVRDVWFLDSFGAAEALWAFEADELPAVVGMDASGDSLFDAVRDASRVRLGQLTVGCR